MELFEMEGQRGSSHIELFGDAPSGHTFRAGLDEQSKNRKPRLLRESGQGRYRRLRIHISMLIEI
jgi:hypothetical protein